MLAMLLAYVPDQRNEYKDEIVKYFDIHENNYDIFLNNIKFFMENKKLNHVSIEPILDFAGNLAEQGKVAEDKHVTTLLDLHKEYNLSKSSKELVSYAKSQKDTDIDNFKLVSKDILKAINSADGFLGLPKDISNLVLSFMSGWQKLQMERNISRFGILPKDASSKNIRNARNNKLTIGF